MPKNEQIIVVTGASGGIGRAVAKAFGARQATVALLARGDLGLRGAAADVKEAGGSASLYLWTCPIRHKCSKPRKRSKAISDPSMSG